VPNGRAGKPAAEQDFAPEIEAQQGPKAARDDLPGGQGDQQEDGQENVDQGEQQPEVEGGAQVAQVFQG